ncbi:Smr/MutS family protein [Chryseobacterium sp. MP_3.2]|uniref:Smr/MutS family protein n=1 Tax=Chryseobacterium sp. MP_3.2 TaxID=3071712 RepID=UPI002E037CFC|nr:dsDNA-specific endonuclease/ATPase MutS2 [Chryseobacterium sp. MP_3.2]
MGKEMKIGDKVSAVDEDFEGIVTSMQGEMVVVKDDYGFTHQFLGTKLVLRNPKLYEGTAIIQKEEKSKTISKKHDKKPMLLDLHFDLLVKNPEKYDAFERLFLQKEKLLKTLDFCRSNHLKKLQIIHGIGDGVLQQMVYDVLESQTNLEFHNKEILHHQSGTVMVFFR